MRLKQIYGPVIGIFILTLVFSGCGETIRGVGRDISRIGRGVKTIFVE